MSYQIKFDPRALLFAELAQDVRDVIVDTINERIEREGLTKATLAEKMGVNKSVVTRSLRGDQNLTLRTIADLCWALGVRPVFSVEPADEDMTLARTAATAVNGRARLKSPSGEGARPMDYSKPGRLPSAAAPEAKVGELQE